MGLPEVVAEAAAPVDAEKLNAGTKDFEEDVEVSTKTNSDADVEARAATQENLVDWEGENDPTKPMNWGNWRKARNIVTVCYCTFLT